MAISIGNNPQTGSTINQFNKSLKERDKYSEQLSTGKRINKASDDAAGLQIVSKLELEDAVSRQETRNIKDTSSLISVSESSLETSSDITTRLSELAMQSANGATSDTQRASIDQEFQALKSELDRTANSTSFNGNQLSGSTTNVSVQGTNIAVSVASSSSSSLGLSSSSVASQSAALTALDDAKRATETISSSRADLGAVDSRLSTSLSGLETSISANAEAASQIRDVDYASAFAERTSRDIRAQAGASLLGIQEIATQNVLKLLQN